MSTQVGIGTIQFPGPGFIPFWSGVTLGALSIILVITSILRKKAEGKITNLWKGMGWRRVIAISASLFIYALLLSELGFLIATFGLLTLLFSMIGRPKLWIQVVKALITVLVTYVVFSLWLDIPLPNGILGF
jgi:hypothetical protein